MTWETLFAVANASVMPFWGLMIVAPYSGLSRRVVGPRWVLLWLPAAYAACIVPTLPVLGPLFTEPPTLATVRGLLASDAGATVGWIHFLAFDLFVGRWILLDGTDRGLSAWALRPILFLTLMLGPIGLLMYLLVTGLRPSPGAAPLESRTPRTSPPA